MLHSISLNKQNQLSLSDYKSVKKIIKSLLDENYSVMLHTHDVNIYLTFGKGTNIHVIEFKVPGFKGFKSVKKSRSVNWDFYEILNFITDRFRNLTEQDDEVKCDSMICGSTSYRTAESHYVTDDGKYCLTENGIFDKDLNKVSMDVLNQKLLTLIEKEEFLMS